MNYTPPRTLPSIDVSMSLLGSPYIANEDQVVIAANVYARAPPKQLESALEPFHEEGSTSVNSYEHAINKTMEDKSNHQEIVQTASTDNYMQEWAENAGSPASTHASLVGEASTWIRELEDFRDDMHMISIKNAILLDSLTMAGADV